ncbi:MAG: response regulator [Ignavibacteriaceae bacterium]|nr:response regulator [Ignavibacteriaceae bacterium]
MKLNISKKILLVDDSTRDAELTLEAFDELGLAEKIDVCYNGLDALDYLEKKGKYKDQVSEYPSLILLDIKMPGLSGLELLKMIKNDPEKKNIPVVMLTSSNHEKDIIESYDLGVNAYVLKPVDFNKFIEAVKLIGQFWINVNEMPRV